MTALDWDKVKSVTEQVDEEAKKRFPDNEPVTINVIIDSRMKLAVLAIQTYIECGETKKRQIEYREGVDNKHLYLVHLENSEATSNYLQTNREEIAEVTY